MNRPSLHIRTPEGICFAQILAGPVARFLAWSLDLFCILVLLTVVSYLVLLLVFVSPGLATAVNTLGYFTVSIGYGMVCEWFWRGQTIGKKVCRLRVVDAEGLRLQFNQVVIRNLLRFVDALPFLYFVGGVACWFSPKCQRLGDLAAGTVVIRQPRLREPDLDQVLPGKYNSLQRYPHLAARLRQAVSPAEAALALEALLRRDQFQPEARIGLFADLAGHFRGKVDFPPEATDGIADEQYIRNVVGVLYSEP